MNKYLILVVIFFQLMGCASHNQHLTISDTTWDYSDSDGDHYQITFLSNGIIKSTNPNDITYDNDFWNQDGKNISFSFNDGYSTYTGMMIDDILVKGKAQNMNRTWDWQMVRIE